jgi:hypothetical protein
MGLRVQNSCRHISEHITEVRVLLIGQILKGDPFALFLVQLQLFSPPVLESENYIERHGEYYENAVATNTVSQLF